MVGKNNEYVNQQKAGHKFEKYSIKKLKVGAASVLIGAGFFLGHHVEASEVVSGTTVVTTQENGTEEKEKKISEVTDTTVQPEVVPTTNNGTTATPKTEVISTSKTEVVETPKSQATPVAEKKANVEAPVEPKVQTTGLQEKVSALQSEVNRIRANEKHKSQIEQAEKLIEEVKDLQASKTATQKEVDAKVKEIKSLTFILKSMKAEETVKPKKNQDSRNNKKIEEGTGFRIGEAAPGSTPSTPQPEGNVIAHGEDGVPWELYGNGYLLFKPEVGKDTLTNNSGESTWKVNYGEQIKHVGFAGKVYAPENSRFIFSKYTYNSNKIDRKFNPLTFDTMYFDTSKVTSMGEMFNGMSNLTNLDVTHFDTSKVTSMNSMFFGLYNITNLDVTHFDTSKVTSMGYMFGKMYNITNLDVTHFDTSKVTNMNAMFINMRNLTNLDVTHFDTSKVTNMSDMFNGVYNITNLDVTHFNTSKVTNMRGMFKDMHNITNLDVTHFDTSKVTNMNYMFKDMHNITNLDVTHFDTSKVTNMSGMFANMRNITNLDVTNFDTSKVTDMDSMLGGTGKLKELKLGDKFKADGIRTIMPTHSYGNQYTDKWHKIEDKEHTYTVSGWADAYAGDSTATAGTWVREVSNATLTFQGENFTPVKVAPSDTALPTLSRPSQPKQNHKFLGWSKDGTNLLTRDAVKPGETITLQPLWQPVNNTTTRTEGIPIATIYRADGTIPFESRQEVAGQEGEKTITTTYTVAPYTGELTNPVESERVTTEMQPKVIKVGNKKVSTEPILVTNKYVGNEEKDRGYSNLITQGQDGLRTITTTYTVNETTGNLSDPSTSETSTPMTQNVYEVGTKPKVIYGKEGDDVVKTTTTHTVDPVTGEVTATPTKETYAKDGAKDTVVYSKEGDDVVKTTTTHTVDPVTGEVTATPTKETYAKDGAKDKVVYSKEGNKVVKSTTTYNVNPDTGAVSEAGTTKETISEDGAKDNAVTPAAKTKVVNPEKLTDAEKKEIEDKVKAANPGAEVVVDDKGKAAVVKDGNISVIPSTDLVKVEGDATKPNGGNDANTPAAKTVVADKESLTPEEKAAVKKAVEAVNSGSTVVVDDKGNATVTKADGTVLNIRASDLVIPAGKLADEVKNAKVKTPATRTLVGAKENLTKDAKEAVKKAIEAVNPGATVVVDNQGNATVTLPDGSTATISNEQLVKDKEAVSKSKYGGDNLDINLSKVEVTNLADITPEEKAKFQFKVLGAITDVAEFDLDAYIKSTEDGKTVYTSKDSKVKITIDKDGNATATVEKDGKKEVAVNIDKAGNVTIVTKEGQVLAIPRDDAFKQRPYVPSNGGGNNGATNTDAKVDKAKLEGAIHQLDELIIKESAKLDAETAKEANDLLADAKKVFANADASQAEVDAMVKRLEEFKLNQALVATDDQAANNAINASNGETSEDVTDAKLAANVSKRNNQKELPNTGTGEEFVIFGAAAASILAGLGVAIPGKKKEDE